MTGIDLKTLDEKQRKDLLEMNRRCKLASELNKLNIEGIELVEFVVDKLIEKKPFSVYAMTNK